MKRIKVRLFGAFRNLETTSEIEIEINESVKTIGSLKARLADHWLAHAKNLSETDTSLGGQRFDVAALIQKSAMASEREILFDDQSILGHELLAILPPVSGG